MNTTQLAETPRILVSQEEAARLLSVERTTVWRMAKRGDLSKVKIGSRTLITRDSIDRYVHEMVEAA